VSQYHNMIWDFNNLGLEKACDWVLKLKCNCDFLGLQQPGT
jgi:hypothetical protein